MTEHGKLETTARFTGKLVTNVIKLAGIVLGLHEGFQNPTEPGVLVLAGFMIAGGTMSQGLIANLLDRIFEVEKK